MNSYFVSYFITLKDGNQAWGNCIIKRDVPIFDVEQVKSVEQLIEKNNNAKQATIMYWRRMEDAE